jgi:hypothetical protein
MLAHPSRKSCGWDEALRAGQARNFDFNVWSNTKRVEKRRYAAFSPSTARW